MMKTLLLEAFSVTDIGRTVSDLLRRRRRVKAIEEITF